MKLPDESIALFSAFADAGVRYLLVGGHAVGAHGRPRATKDVDLWIDPSRKNVERACEALLRFGAPSEIAVALREAQPNEIVWMGRVPMRIDFLQSLPGVDFGTCWPSRLEVDVGAARVWVIGKDDLIRNKETVGRPQDRRDVRALRGTSPSGATKSPAKKK